MNETMKTMKIDLKIKPKCYLKNEQLAISVVIINTGLLGATTIKREASWTHDEEASFK